MITASLVYFLCAITSAACAILLTRAWFSTRDRLLLWSSLCFALLTVSNVLLIIDLTILPSQVDLLVPRSVTFLLGAGLMLFGLIWELRS